MNEPMRRLSWLCKSERRALHASPELAIHRQPGPVHHSWLKDSTSRLDVQGKCSFFVPMAHDPIDTLGKATRHNMLVKAECSCGNVRYCRSADLMMVYGGGADPLKLKFDCNRCKPDIKITLLEVHPEHLPKRLVIHKPMKVDGKITWYTERFRG
ncbi:MULTISPECIES: hypothetical protein [Mesorhizobium]|nr:MULTISPECIES: hypothetical protein [Mesorhizobium]